MTASQPSLFLTGWQEECGDPDERAFVDLHGPQPRPTGFEADPWHGYARPATRAVRRFNPCQPIDDVLEDL